MTNTRCAKMNRMFVFYFSLNFNLIIVLTTMGICNTNPEIYHSNNLFEQNIVMLNIVCSLAVGCLLLSWILDILCQNVSDYGGVFHSLWREIMTPKWEGFLMDIQKAVQENDWLFIIVSLSCYSWIDLHTIILLQEIWLSRMTLLLLFQYLVFILKYLFQHKIEWLNEFINIFHRSTINILKTKF